LNPPIHLYPGETMFITIVVERPNGVPRYLTCHAIEAQKEDEPANAPKPPPFQAAQGVEP